MGKSRRSMQVGWALILAGLVIVPAPLRAQLEAKRKVKSQVEAVYPEIARQRVLPGANTSS